MKGILRSILAVLAGVVIGAIIVGSVEAVNSRIFPMPPNLDINDRAAMGEFIRTLPAGAFVVALIGWALATLVGA